MTRKYSKFALLVSLCVPLSTAAWGADWPEYRGPMRDGKSGETGLPEKWSALSEVAWSAPYGGRSTPIVMGGRIYMVNPAGADELLQERLVCLDAATGKLVWERKWNVYHSDVPPHRIAWAPPAGDPETGNIYVFGAGGEFMAYDRDGKLLFERSLVEEFGIVTTHGGRTAPPVVEGNLVILSGITTGWGDQARAAHRFLAFDKKTGETVYVSTPGGRPFDTTYSPPVVVTYAGQRLLVAGGGDGTMHAIQALTGKPVWKFPMSKRGLNTGAAIVGDLALVSHSEENLNTSDMGLIAAVPMSSKGDVTAEKLAWAAPGMQMGFSSPVVDGDRFYQIDNSSNLYGYDVKTGKQLWKKNLGTIQKASPVLADGKLYVGNENGRFFILKPSATDVEVLSSIQLGSKDEIEEITASPAVADGRVFVVSQRAIYAIGKGSAPAAAAKPAGTLSAGAAAQALVVPTELALAPGESAQFRVRLYDANGNFVREEAGATWALEGLKGSADGGKFTAQAGSQAGMVKATVAGITGTARVRVLAPVPVSEDFESVAANAVPRHWINTTGKYQVREVEGGGKRLAKLADNPFTKRARSFFGLPSEHDYTIEAEVMATEKRRQMGDAGVVAQRYQLVMYGNHQRVELEAWQPETKRTAQVKFAWTKDTWYKMKLRVENLPDGKVKAQGKVWPAAESEPAAWTIERVDPIGNREGAPGIYADAPFEVFFDNIKVSKN